MSKTLSSKNDDSLWSNAIFGIVFLLVGLASISFQFVRPVWWYFSAKDWVATPCTILTNELKADSESCSVHVTYAYTANGHPYVGDRYDLSPGSSTVTSTRKKQFVNQNPSGTQTLCYVDPAEPSQSVIYRNLPGDVWPWLLALLFVAGGCYLFNDSASTFRARRLDASASTITPTPAKTPPGHKSIQLNNPSYSIQENDPDFLPYFPPTTRSIELPRNPRNWAQVIASGFFAILWNGVIWLGISQLDRAPGSALPEIIDLLFMFPFVIIGLALLGIFLRLRHLYYHPIARCTMKPIHLRPGGQMILSWKIPKGAQRIKRLVISLKALERSHVCDGESDYTHTNPFMHFTLADTARPTEIASGQATLTLPDRLLHTIQFSHCEITWQIQVRATIPIFPDIKDDYDVVVLPANWPAKEPSIR